MSRLPWYRLITARLSEPAVITAFQICSHFAAALAGALAVAGAFPYLLYGLPPVLTFAVGLVLVVGGLAGAAACLRGVWVVERIALMLVGLGWVSIVPSVLFVRLPGMVKLFILLLLAVAVFDVCKRYRHIDWAYLDPTK